MKKTLLWGVGAWVIFGMIGFTRVRADTYCGTGLTCPSGVGFEYRDVNECKSVPGTGCLEVWDYKWADCGTGYVGTTPVCRLGGASGLSDRGYACGAYDKGCPVLTNQVACCPGSSGDDPPVYTCEWRPAGQYNCGTEGLNSTSWGLMYQIYNYGSGGWFNEPMTPGGWTRTAGYAAEGDTRGWSTWSTVWETTLCRSQAFGVRWWGYLHLTPGTWRFRIHYKFHETGGAASFAIGQPNDALPDPPVGVLTPLFERLGEWSVWMREVEETRDVTFNAATDNWYPIEAKLFTRGDNIFNYYYVEAWRPDGSLVWDFRNNWGGSGPEGELGILRACQQCTPVGPTFSGNVSVARNCDNVTVTWPAQANAASYDLIVDGATTITGVTSPYIYTPGNCNNHTYQIRANGCSGSTAISAASAATAAYCAPAPPTNVTVAADDEYNKLIVSFRDGSTNETEFRLFNSAAIGTPLGTVASTTTAGTGTAYTYTDLSTACNTMYPYYVRAFTGGNPPACRYSATYAYGQGSYGCYTNSWYQTQGGGVMAGGDLQMYLPPDPGPGLPQPVWLLSGEPLAGTILGTPGTVYARSFAGSIDPDVVDFDRISETGWMGKTDPGWESFLGKSENHYGTIKERVVPRLDSTPDSLPSGSSLDQTTLTEEINGTHSRTADWVTPPVRVLVVGGNLTLNGDINLGNNRVVIFADGSVNLNGNLDVNLPGEAPGASGFVAIIAKENISINPSVGIDPLVNPPYQVDLSPNTTPAQLTGIFYAEGSLTTGSGAAVPGYRDKQLKVDGSLVGWTQVSLQRRSLGPYPSELVHFNPYLTRTLREVGLRRIIRQQLVNP